MLEPKTLFVKAKCESGVRSCHLLFAQFKVSLCASALFVCLHVIFVYLAVPSFCVLPACIWNAHSAHMTENMFILYILLTNLSYCRFDAYVARLTYIIFICKLWQLQKLPYDFHFVVAVVCGDDDISSFSVFVFSQSNRNGKWYEHVYIRMVYLMRKYDNAFAWIWAFMSICEPAKKKHNFCSSS